MNESSAPAPGFLEDLLRVAVHDVRGPLNQVSALTGMLCAQHKSALGEDGQRLCEYIEQAAGRAAAVVDAIHAYATVLSVPAMETLGMDSIFAAARAELADEIERRGAIVAGAELGQVSGDRRMLLMLLRELLNNALKFNHAEPPEARLTVSAAGASMEYSMVDNGMGIPNDRAETAFKPLRRLHGFEYEGAGMGLAIARRIVEAHGGRIGIASAPGGGTEVRFTLPSCRARTG